MYWIGVRGATRRIERGLVSGVAGSSPVEDLIRWKTAPGGNEASDSRVWWYVTLRWYFDHVIE